MNIHEYDYSSRFKSLSKARVFMTAIDKVDFGHFCVIKTFQFITAPSMLLTFYVADNCDVGDRFLKSHPDHHRVTNITL